MNLKDKEKRIIFEDNHLIIVNKLPGELVQGDHTGRSTLSDWTKDYLKEKYAKPGNVFLGTIHRIDQPVSGLVMFARTSKALSRMNELLRTSKVQKSYIAVCSGKLVNDQARLSDYLIKDSNTNVSRVVSRGKNNADAKLAVLDYKLIAQIDSYNVLFISILTGRPHQIRVQLSNIKSPILNDIKYGSTVRNSYDGIFLHSFRTAFIHPVTKEEISLTAPLPDYPLWRRINDFTSY
jgi:23S rRNA pseudouridine1911/1915/1917 synthase